jgi:hypothetical protein
MNESSGRDSGRATGAGLDCKRAATSASQFGAGERLLPQTVVSYRQLGKATSRATVATGLALLRGRLAFDQMNRKFRGGMTVPSDKSRLVLGRLV